MDGTQPTQNNMQSFTTDVANLTEQLKAAKVRTNHLQRQQTEPLQNDQRLPDTFVELQGMRDQLNTTDNELRQQRDELFETRLQIEQEQRRYHDLFEFAPDGYLVTNLRGVVEEVNLAAAMLFNRHQRFLRNRPLGVLITPSDKRSFYEWFAQLSKSYAVQQWEGQLQPSKKQQPIDVSMRVSIIRSADGKPDQFLWQIRDITELNNRKNELQLLNERLLEVQETERRALARELHDEIGQVLTSLKIMLTAEDDNRTAALEVVSGLIQQVREMSLKLRPAMLDDLGLIPTLQWFFERYMVQTKINVKFTCTGIDERLPAEIETAVYRIVQESLTNAARHAHTPEVSINIWVNDGILYLEITDQGIGFDYEEARKKASSGLRGMRERATMLGGELHIAAARQRGSSIRASIPLL